MVKDVNINEYDKGYVNDDYDVMLTFNCIRVENVENIRLEFSLEKKYEKKFKKNKII